MSAPARLTAASPTPRKGGRSMQSRTSSSRSSPRRSRRRACPGADLLDVGAGDPLDAALCEERLRKQAAGGHVAAALEVQPAHAEVAQLVLVGEEDHAGTISHAMAAQLMLDIEDILEGRALAGAGAVPHADDQRLVFPALHAVDARAESAGCLDGVVGGADGPAVASVRPESGCRSEVELRTGGIDQVVVGLTGYRSIRCCARRRVFNVRLRQLLRAFRTDGRRASLAEVHANPCIQRREWKHHVPPLHRTHSHPDVGRVSSSTPHPARRPRFHGCARVSSAAKSRQYDRRCRLRE